MWPSRYYQTLVALSLGAIVLPACHGAAPNSSPRGQSTPTTAARVLSPAAWPTEELTRYLSGPTGGPVSHEQVESAHGMVAATSSAFAARAGVEALKAGGSAADVAIATMLAQIAASGGSGYSYAGFLSAMIYDATSGKVYSLNAPFRVPRGETDPLSIPKGATGIPPFTGFSGRSAYVPGVMAGAQALHDRFGKLPWATVFEPAIFLADHGFVLGSRARQITGQRQALSRLPETRAVFFKPDGSAYGESDVWRQPALAATLRKVAAEGSAYMYRGPWAEHFVAAVQREGGHMTMDDLTSYRVLWNEPLSTDFYGYRLFAPAPPGYLGVSVLAALNLFEAADLRRVGHPTTSARALYEFLRMAEASAELGGYTWDAHSNVPEARQYFPEVDFSPAGMVDRGNMRRLWRQMNTQAWTQFIRAVGNTRPLNELEHTAAVTAVDAAGNAVALTHTINTVGWGTTGLFVDGVSIPDAAAFQQEATLAAIRNEGPGAAMSVGVVPVIATRNGRFVLGGASVGNTAQVTIQSVANLLAYGMAPKAAVDTGQFDQPPNIQNGVLTVPLPRNTFADTIVNGLRALGMHFGEPQIRGGMVRPTGGGIALVLVDSVTHRLKGAVTRFNNGVEGY